MTENRLARETSPYLLQHAHNPVDWYPWGSEAFQKAASERKPIFLSIGYSTCHWCHVMERESFENQAVAEILQDGGNAFDACIAGLFMTFVAEAVFASPGGGGFLMARRAGSDKITLFDFFAETPRKRRPASEIDFYPIYADFGPAKQEFHIGAGSSATPGVVPGLFAMHQELCRLPMKRLVEPAVRAARAGFPLSAFQAYLLTVIAPILKATAGVANIFAPGDTLLKAGETFSNPASIFRSRASLR